MNKKYVLMSLCQKNNMRKICFYVFTLNYLYIYHQKSGVILKKKGDGRK